MSGAKLPLAARKSIRDEFDPYVPVFEKDMETLFGNKWTMEIPWAECIETNTNRGFADKPGDRMKGFFEKGILQLKQLTKEGKDEMVVEAINENADKHIMAIVIDDTIEGFSGCKFEDGKLCIIFKKGDYFGSNTDRTFAKLMSLL
ncbi:hypothetical protein K439DRAFT_203101 [Ramaria rubella]|nr:hypothetical protein K439DRAFT_203101 [Ramaria rubella]